MLVIKDDAKKDFFGDFSVKKIVVVPSTRAIALLNSTKKIHSLKSGFF